MDYYFCSPDFAQMAGGQCWSVYAEMQSFAVTPFAYVLVCKSTIDACSADNGNASSTIDVWTPITALSGSENLWGIDPTGNAVLVPSSGVAFGNAQFTVPFDLSSLSSADATAYMSWGFFVIALGWAAGFGIKKAIQFLRQI